MSPVSYKSLGRGGDFITLRGAMTAEEFGLALVRRLFGPEKERAVTAGIMP